jgi:hypothetical protein
MGTNQSIYVENGMQKDNTEHRRPVTKGIKNGR